MSRAMMIERFWVPSELPPPRSGWDGAEGHKQDECFR